MPHAICEQGHVLRWRGRSGYRMPRKCPECGAPVARAAFVDGKLEPIKGRRRIKCERHGNYYYTPNTGCHCCRLEAIRDRGGADDA
ncbi:MAG TPA: hypothetical protein ENK43_01280 [Planctomycetes bacterium]|nr:hypothetical protein [Planctomycetota bacterium]